MSAHGLPFPSKTLLAPMEGVTDPVFRRLVLARNPPETLGGVFTEFLRVSDHPIRKARISAHLGPLPPSAQGAPGAVVGLQLLGPDPDAMGETARRAAELGVSIVDLNFGCPAKGALRSCAGSALLDRPAEIEKLVRRCVEGAGGIAVSAKIRAGGEDDHGLEGIARAVEAGGAALLTVHCRTRAEGYRGEGDWERISRAVQAVSIPVCGNGGIESRSDIERMRRETGCEYTMVGRAALANPWIFRGGNVTREEAAHFFLEYAERLRTERGASPRKVMGRIKQLLRSWKVAGLFATNRGKMLAEPNPEVFLREMAREGLS